MIADARSHRRRRTARAVTHAPTDGQMAQAVKGSVGASGSSLRPLRLPRLAKRQSLLLPFAFPEPGTVKLDLVAKGQTVGTGTKSSTANGKFDVSIKLTPAGRKLFKRTKKTLKVTLKGTFTPARTGQRRPQRGRDRHTQAMTRRLLTALIAILAVSSQLPRRRVGVRPDHLHDAAGRAGTQVEAFDLDSEAPLRIELVRGGAVIAVGRRRGRGAAARAGRHGQDRAC